jgi:FtsP/CotA-like multicopper oxidase with cupredoxin domain
MVSAGARRHVIDVAGAPLEAQPFNGGLIGPTLRVRPGDRFHCHSLGHEDAGMMQTVQVLGPGQQPAPPPDHGHAAMHAAPA